MKYTLRLAMICMALIMAIVLLLAGCGEPVDPTVPETTVPEATVLATIPATIPGPTCPLPLDDWRMQLVNKEHPISEDYQSPELTKVSYRFYVDSRCYEDLNAMLEACRADGLTPVICSAYRTLNDQIYLFNRKLQRLRAQGMTEAEAYDRAQIVVALPGASEHHTGLAVDLVDYAYQELDEQQEQTAVQQWLLENCWDYGFILRYPNGKSDITGIIYEPWHYRYVGREVAAELRNSGLCFEEYVAQFGY